MRIICKGKGFFGGQRNSLYKGRNGWIQGEGLLAQTNANNKLVQSSAIARTVSQVPISCDEWEPLSLDKSDLSTSVTMAQGKEFLGTAAGFSRII